MSRSGPVHHVLLILAVDAFRAGCRPRIRTQESALFFFLLVVFFAGRVPVVLMKESGRSGGRLGGQEGRHGRIVVVGALRFVAADAHRFRLLAALVAGQLLVNSGRALAASGAIGPFAADGHVVIVRAAVVSRPFLAEPGATVVQLSLVPEERLGVGRSGGRCSRRHVRLERIEAVVLAGRRCGFHGCRRV
ncbi:Uncharacterized protein APZ42_032809 [Daphnia magna]|uniref:Uncharacterized protein n=1 Tax=Daphnia magna TaxID=35525 RepID=A0A164LV63_9CRUS|nr:Uncharacterized protein APZ42_032809 [Daphnia magna]